ncbi:MAG: hypothetical protein A2W85_14830 [Bacteroidetes bacterium GWF2_41_31]|nr:MAG: hypothetical protein A2W85_14830 [Bacteroidetes bacterium GWF2_41_31]
MVGNVKNIASLLLFLVFLLPSLVKLEHHHKRFECKSGSGTHYHSFQEKCAICNFEFSVFSSDFENIVLQKRQPLAKYRNHYKSVNYSTLSTYSFLLRAPPDSQI